MVEATLDLQWIPKAKCPMRAIVHNVDSISEVIKNRPYQTMRLTLVSEGSFYQYDAKFTDKNFLINTWGPQTDGWIGRELWITIDPETGYRRISLEVKL